MRVCVDASLILASLLKEELSAYTDALITAWTSVGAELLAPPLFGLEVPSGLRQATHRKRIEVSEADQLFDFFHGFPIRILDSDDLLQKAWAIARELNAPRLYDMLYIALAEIEDCEFWTADRKLVNLASGRFPRVHFVGESPP